jgi:hypothetical protein
VFVSCIFLSVAVLEKVIGKIDRLLAKMSVIAGQAPAHA